MIDIFFLSMFVLIVFLVGILYAFSLAGRTARIWGKRNEPRAAAEPREAHTHIGGHGSKVYRVRQRARAR